MYYGSMTGIPVINTYEEALAHYESIKPIRGTDNVRPICYGANGRRKKHMSIRLGQEKGVKSVDCVLYNTIVAQYLEDGTLVIKDGGWPSTTTHSFLNEVLPGMSQWANKDVRGIVGTRIMSGQSVLELVSMDGREYYPFGKEGLQMKLTAGTGEVAVLNAPVRTKEYIDRKAMSELRKTYKLQIAYIRRMLKILDPNTVVASSRDNAPYDMWECFISEEQADWYAVASAVYARALTRDYNWELRDFVYQVPLDKVNAEITDLLVDNNRDTVIEVREVPATVKP
tara:strand:+ start:758 stop:1609 length:852 start_codon:yes stop_codon:yes gene_type:complete